MMPSRNTWMETCGGGSVGSVDIGSIAENERAGALLRHVFHHPFRADLGAVDVAHRVGRDALRRARAGGLVHGIGNERRHRTVLGAANAYSPLPAVVVLG